MEQLILGSIFLFVLLLLSASFSALETAFYSIDRFKVTRFVKKKRPGALELQNLKKNPTRFLVAVLLLNNVVNIAAASFATTLVLRIFPENIAIAIATFGITFLVLVFGEIIPKSLAVKHAVKIMLLVSGAFSLVMFVLLPIIIFLEKLSFFFIGSNKKESLTKEEVRMIVSLGVEEGAIDKSEREIIHRVFTLDDTTVETIMTPRIEVVMLDSRKKLSSIKNFLKKNPYSKIPIYDGEVDNIIGIFNVRQLINYLGKNLRISVGNLIDPPFFVPSSKKIGDLLKEFQERKIHIAIVVDEFGSFLGVITLEDIIEELVGEITEDKDDEYEVKIINERTIIVEGGTELSTVNYELGTAFKSERYNTVAGLLLEKMDRIPKEGEKLKVGSAIFEIVKMKNARIDKVKITIN
jgi:putative hemolysin